MTEDIPQRVADVVARVRDAGRIAATPARGETWDDINEYKDRVRATAWAADLHTQNLTEHAGRTINDIDAKHRERIEAYTRGIAPGGPRVKLNLILAGTVGAGKTTAAVAAGTLAVTLGLSVRIVSHQAYLAMLRPDGAPPGTTAAGIQRRYREVDLLIVDDLCAGMRPDMPAREFVEAQSIGLFGDRLGSGRATIFTTNETSDVVNVVLGERNMSRIGAAAHVRIFDNPDRRAPVKW